MKNLIIGLFIFTVFQIHAQSYTGIVDPNYRGALLYPQPGFQGQPVPLRNIGQYVNYAAKSVQVFGGYKLEVNINGNISTITQDDSNIGNSSTPRRYTLRAHNQFYPAIMYSGANQSGIAWYIPLNVTMTPNSAGWSSHFPNGNPTCVFARQYYEIKYLLEGENDYRYKCGGVVNNSAGISSIQISQGCANSGQNTNTNTNNTNTNNTNTNNTNLPVTIYGGPNQTGAFFSYGPGNVDLSQLQPATIRSLRVPSGYVVRIKTFNRYNIRQRNKCYRITSTSTLPTSIGNGQMETVTEISICGPNASSLNCRCN